MVSSWSIGTAKRGNLGNTNNTPVNIIKSLI